MGVTSTLILLYFVLTCVGAPMLSAVIILSIIQTNDWTYNIVNTDSCTLIDSVIVSPKKCINCNNYVYRTFVASNNKTYTCTLDEFIETRRQQHCKEKDTIEQTKQTQKIGKTIEFSTDWIMNSPVECHLERNYITPIHKLINSDLYDVYLKAGPNKELTAIYLVLIGIVAGIPCGIVIMSLNVSIILIFTSYSKLCCKKKTKQISSSVSSPV